MCFFSSSSFFVCFFACVRCLSVCVQCVYICVGIGLVDLTWESINMRRVLNCTFAYDRVWLSVGDPCSWQDVEIQLLINWLTTFFESHDGFESHGGPLLQFCCTFMALWLWFSMHSHSFSSLLLWDTRICTWCATLPKEYFSYSKSLINKVYMPLIIWPECMCLPSVTCHSILGNLLSVSLG